MSRRILCVDDDPNLLQALMRQYGRRFDMQIAVGPQQGIMALQDNGPFAAVVSDLRMPGLDGIGFLSVARHTSPDTVRIMLTGHGDLQSALAAVNQAKIFQFLTKPCPSETFCQTVESALEQHRLIVAERELQEKTLHGMVGILSEILSLVSPVAFSRAGRIRRNVQEMCAVLKLADPWQYELAAMLCQIGCVNLPAETLVRFQTGLGLSADERRMLGEQDRLAYDLLIRIPRLEKIAQMVLRQHVGWAGERSLEDPVKIGGYLLKIALDLDQHITEGKPVSLAREEIQVRLDYHPLLKSALLQIPVEEARSETYKLSVAQLEPHMITVGPVMAKNGILLVAAGQELAQSAVARIKGFAQTVGVVEPIGVRVPMQPSQNAGN